MVDCAGRALRYLAAQLPRAERHSAEEMFLWLLERGVLARQTGNYGIAAAYVVRHAGSEMVCFGQNTMFSDHDPTGHAEIGALRKAQRAIHGASPPLPEDIIVRAAPHTRQESILYSTLEPCPMCTVAIINAGIERVVVGHGDGAAGAMMHLHALPPLWGDLAAERDIDIRAVAAGRGPDAIPQELLDLLHDLFFDEREDLDSQLTTTGVLATKHLGEVLARAVADA